MNDVDAVLDEWGFGDTPKPKNEFYRDLAFSHEAEDHPMWEGIYRKAFGRFQAMNCHRQDGDHQRVGIDRSVTLTNGKIIWIDEKVRRKDYSDIALEYKSKVECNAPGWVCKELMCDYIAYAILPTGKCYLLPVPQLQLAFRNNGRAWIEEYGEREALNQSWTTLFVPVPVPVLFKAIGGCLRMEFEPQPNAS